MSNIFTAKSPLGYVVSCTQSQWDNHILARHPNMRGNEAIVANTISNPHKIHPSKEPPGRDVYFAHSGNTNEKLQFMKVIVAPPVNNEAEVISAWMQASIKGNIDPGVEKYVDPKL
ncbi:MAG: hypothetical protein FWB71_03085 [Defluviitaleaceae bacterium]|nr:hypothetical protein [Defluviitaleaceae bacterium]